VILDPPRFSDDQISRETARVVASKLLAYCRTSNWAGYDPYDALNSRLLERLPFLNSRVPRLVLTQALKRSPINVRPLALVPKTQNPKALALFLSALVRLRDDGSADREALGSLLIQRLVALRSPEVQYWCWGYSFPWQTRTILVPRWTPNLVCTTFVAGALLDVYERRHDARCLSMALSAAEYLLNELYWTGNGGRSAGFAYPLRSQRFSIHNANFLGSELLCRLYVLTGQSRFLEPALAVARYSAACQQHDGSWRYGEGPNQGWIDNFHTGYNLNALRHISQYLKSGEFDACIDRGFDFYRARFFRSDGAPCYFHDRTYPIDIHCVAQGIITLLAFRDVYPGSLELARLVFRWALTHMWDDRGFFYYRLLRLGTIRTSYMRWSQAWMLLAIANLLDESTTETGTDGTHATA
jgi:hypothetical protein